MITIYEAADPIDAQRVVDLLASEGIAAHVSGSYLSGAIGEIPAGGLVRVWVDDAVAEHALAFLAEDAAAEPLPDDDEPATPPAPPRSLLVPVFGSMLVGIVVGFALAAMHYGTEGETRSADLDGDTEPDYLEEYQGGVLQTIRVDRNRDGQIDEVTESASASDSIIRSDDDFDGRFETEVQYADWEPVWTEVDVDGDDHAEWRDEFKHGVVVTSTLRDPASAAIVKRVTFFGGFPVLEEFDADGDGTLETTRHFDARGEIKP